MRVNPFRYVRYSSSSERFAGEGRIETTGLQDID
jgi:hypothetical protein